MNSHAREEEEKKEKEEGWKGEVKPQDGIDFQGRDKADYVNEERELKSIFQGVRWNVEEKKS